LKKIGVEWLLLGDKELSPTSLAKELDLPCWETTKQGDTISRLLLKETYITAHEDKLTKVKAKMDGELVEIKALPSIAKEWTEEK